MEQESSKVMTSTRKSVRRPMSREDINAEYRGFEVRRLIEEIRMLGLEPPLGLKCALALYIAGRATTEEVQGYLDLQLSDPVSSLEACHA